MDTSEQMIIAQLIRGQRWGALGTLREGRPFVSWVAFAPEDDFQSLLLHLSQLAAHTRHLLADPRAALAISEPEASADDPQTLARISLQGHVEQIATGSADYATAKERYQRWLPASELPFSLPDFLLFRFVVEDARYIGGFGRAFTLTPEHLRRVALVE